MNRTNSNTRQSSKNQPASAARRQRTRGFTLIELMIVVAIISILGAIAYPSYQEYVRKSRRAEGRTALIELLQQQERYMTQNNTYLAVSTAGDNTVPLKMFSGDARDKAAYWLGARACTNQTIANCVQVFGVPKYTDPAITELNVTSTGVKSCSGNDTSVCWK